MSALAWIIFSGVAMGLVSLIGAMTFVVREKTLKKMLLPMVAFSAGSLFGGAFFHMIPASVETLKNSIWVYVWVVIGFTTFFCMEQFLHWHHCHKTESEHKAPLTYLVLMADGLHNFIGGLGVAASFMVDIRLGVGTLIAAAAHEIPQELGDFGILLHGGWEKKKALLFNFVSSLTFLLGGFVAYVSQSQIEVAYLLAFAAGNFVYIAAADLIPEIKHYVSVRTNMAHFLYFSGGLAFLLWVRVALE